MDGDERPRHEKGTVAQRRARIVTATMPLIARDGIAGLSTRMIAREANVNLSVLHGLFGGKDDLLLAVLDTATSAMIATLVAVDGHPGGGLRVALTESFAALCALLDRMPALPLIRCEVLLYACRRPARAAGACRQQQRYLDALQTCYRVACAPGELGLIAFDELAALVGSSIDGLALQTAEGVPLPQQAATRAHMLRALMSTAFGPRALDDGGAAGRVVPLFEEPIGSIRQQ
jgi:AcrR family transcriptional regulator